MSPARAGRTCIIRPFKKDNDPEDFSTQCQIMLLCHRCRPPKSRSPRVVPAPACGGLPPHGTVQTLTEKGRKRGTREGQDRFHVPQNSFLLDTQNVWPFTEDKTMRLLPFLFTKIIATTLPGKAGMRDITERALNRPFAVDCHRNERLKRSPRTSGTWDTRRTGSISRPAKFVPTEHTRVCLFTKVETTSKAVMKISII